MKTFLRVLPLGILGLIVFVALSIRQVQPDRDRFLARAKVGSLAGYLRQYHQFNQGRATSLREVVIAMRRAVHAGLAPDQRDWNPEVLTPDDEQVFIDAWGRNITLDYQTYETYETGLSWVTVRSAGPDGVPLTLDDITERVLVRVR